VSEPIYELTPGDGPLIISMPHSGTYLPADLASRLAAPARDLPDTDWFVPQLYDRHATLGATVIRATHARYVVDLNRPPDGAPLYPGQRETGVCPTETFDGEPLYAGGDGPQREEIAARLTAYWQPYHDRLAGLIQEKLRQHGRCVLWDAHSIRSAVPALFEGRLPDLNVGTADGRSCSASACARVVRALGAQSRFSFVVNGRYKGGFITRHYGNPTARVDAVQLEIAQAAYLMEARVPAFDAAQAEPLCELLPILLRSVLAG